jgi:hypothetical protein
VDAGVACAGAQCAVDGGGGTELPGVINGNAEIGGADVLTDGADGGIAENGDEGGGGTVREGGGGTDAARRVGGGGTVREGAALPALATGGADGLRGRVSDSKMSSARTTEGRDAPVLVDAPRGAGVGSEGAPSIHSANSLDSRPCLAASMKLLSLTELMKVHLGQAHPFSYISIPKTLCPAIVRRRASIRTPPFMNKFEHSGQWPSQPVGAPGPEPSLELTKRALLIADLTTTTFAPPWTRRPR